jgi:O-antigen/teichoic acid export membrane protein
MTSEDTSVAAGRPDAAPAGDAADAVARHIRGSALMLAGRGLAMGVGFVTQVLVVRHLSKDDFGTFAFGLSAALLLQSIVPLGLDRADTRFLALYEHRRDHARLLGVIVFEAAVAVVLGILAVVLVWTFPGILSGSEGGSGTAGAVLVLMIALAPIQALDVLVVNVFAVFASPWAVFVRRFVLEPGLRFVVAVALVVTGAGVLFLAVGYVVAGLLGVGLYAMLMIGLLSRRGFLHDGAPRRIEVPARELLAFSLPLLFTNVVAVASTDLAAVALGHYGSASEVASFRAIQPFAALNLVVMYSFGTLFTPAAARLWARGDHDGLRRLYWQSASWVAVLSFPVFCVTTALAHPLTVTSIGERYAGSATYLAVLSVGYYVNAALGFNGLTVQMLGRIRYMIGANLAVLVWMIAVNGLLIPRWGAAGAVAAVLTTLLLHNVAKQAGLGFGAPIGAVDRRHAIVLAQIAGATAACNVLTAVLDPPLAVGLLLVGVATVLLFRLAAPSLNVGETVPELARMPFVRWVLR